MWCGIGRCEGSGLEGEGDERRGLDIAVVVACFMLRLNLWWSSLMPARGNGHTVMVFLFR